MAALVEPLSISMHAVARSGASKGDFVLVSGAGPIGMGAALMARLEGANVAITDTNAERRRFAKEVFGIPLILDPLGSDYKGKLEDWTNGEMPDIIINSTGNNQSMAADVPMLSNGGRLVWVGISNAKIAIDGTAFHLRETELYDSRAAFRCDFDNVLAAIESKKLDPLQMITHSAHFPDAEDAFKEWESLRGAVFKAIILMD
jgi:threonine dehydrogenase-like Zn-dependent dehydrogenase